jgi:hypothetical protein
MLSENLTEETHERQAVQQVEGADPNIELRIHSACGQHGTAICFRVLSLIISNYSRLRNLKLQI